jgi:hypothetical protein
VRQREGVVSRSQAALLQLLEGRTVTRGPAPGSPGARGLVTVVLGAACAIALACGGAQRSATSSAPPIAAHGELGDPRAEIEALDRQITDELARAEVAPPAVASCSGAACGATMAEPFATPTASDPACHPAPSQRCTDVCRLGDSVCRNQDRICELARQLADDGAANKCRRARASCQAAHERCCSCAA